MLLAESYRQILAQLKEDQRPLWKPTEGELAEMEEIWRKFLHGEVSQEELIPCLCLLSYSRTLTERFDLLLFETLSLSSLGAEVLVVALGCLQRQIMDRCEMRGERFPPRVGECLKGLLDHNHPEVFHWCLRTIERMGSMSLGLREEILGKCPGRWESLFCSHKKASRKIVASLVGQWKSLGIS